MKAYKTKQEMIADYRSRNPALAESVACSKAKYIPHLYRGGYVIPGFGFSIERIGVYVAVDNCGEPTLVS